jgi:hypothetical protein
MERGALVELPYDAPRDAPCDAPRDAPRDSEAWGQDFRGLCYFPGPRLGRCFRWPTG